MQERLLVADDAHGASLEEDATGFTVRGGDGALGGAPEEELLSLANDVDHDARSAFLACDVDGDGAISATELHAVLRALGCRGLGLDSVAAMVARAEQSFAVEQAAMRRGAREPIRRFAREFQLPKLQRTERPPPRPIGERKGLGRKAKAAVAKPLVLARRASQRAVYRVIHQVSQSRRYAAGVTDTIAGTVGGVLGDGAHAVASAMRDASAPVRFEGVRCQFGRATESEFVAVECAAATCHAYLPRQ
jgi:hypothetical protein